MWVELEVTPKGVDDGHNCRCVSKLAFGVKKDGTSGRLHQDTESDLSMDLDNGPKDVGDGKNDVLVGDVEECGLVFIDPVVSLHGATARAESGFASEVDLFCKTAALALIYGMPKTDLALQDFRTLRTLVMTASRMRWAYFLTKASQLPLALKISAIDVPVTTSTDIKSSLGQRIRQDPSEVGPKALSSL